MSFAVRLTFLLILCFLPKYSTAEEISVAVATNFIKPLSQIAKDFELKTDHKVILHPGSSGQIYAQALHGAPFDLFLSADELRVDKLIVAELAHKEDKAIYACGILSLWSSKRSLSELAEPLKIPQLGKVALANPRTAPYGLAAEQVLNKLARSQDLKLIKAQNVSSSFQYAYTGAVDASFVALSQLIAMKIDPSEAWTIPQSYYQPIKQSAVILKSSKSKAGKLFFQYLLSKETQRKIQSMGYTSAIDC